MIACHVEEGSGVASRQVTLMQKEISTDGDLRHTKTEHPEAPVVLIRAAKTTWTWWVTGILAWRTRLRVGLASTAAALSQ